MPIDLGKLSEALKAAITTAGIYKFALAIVFGLYWVAASKQIIPSAQDWEIRVAASGFLLFGVLWIANVFAAVWRFFTPATMLNNWITLRWERARVRDYIPSMTEKEREIIGYLIAKNQKLFIAAHDGGFAMPLISQRIVIIALQPGQLFDSEHTPMAIPIIFGKFFSLTKSVFHTHHLGAKLRVTRGAFLGWHGELYSPLPSGGAASLPRLARQSLKSRFACRIERASPAAVTSGSSYGGASDRSARRQIAMVRGPAPAARKVRKRSSCLIGKPQVCPSKWICRGGNGIERGIDGIAGDIVLRGRQVQRAGELRVQGDHRRAEQSKKSGDDVLKRGGLDQFARLPAQARFGSFGLRRLQPGARL